MRLDTPFLKLPIRFDADALAAEIRALPPSAWVPHPTGFKGNEAVRLVSVGGGPNDDFRGEMAPTEHLRASPYIMQIMGELGGVWGRSRLMGLGPGGEVPKHVDTHYYWRTHWRIHIPAITNPDVTFICGPESVHMRAGECWLFDSFRWHTVQNAGSAQRVHLVLDTVGGPRFWDLVESAQAGATDVRLVPPALGQANNLAFERFNSLDLMSPWEVRAHVAFLAEHAVPHPLLSTVLARLDRFVADWAAAWAQFGKDEGSESYLQILEGLKRDLAAIRGGDIMLANRVGLYVALDNMMLMHIAEQLIGPELRAALQRRTASRGA